MMMMRVGGGERRRWRVNGEGDGGEKGEGRREKEDEVVVVVVEVRKGKERKGRERKTQTETERTLFKVPSSPAQSNPVPSKFLLVDRSVGWSMYLCILALFGLPRFLTAFPPSPLSSTHLVSSRFTSPLRWSLLLCRMVAPLSDRPFPQRRDLVRQWPWTAQ